MRSLWTMRDLADLPRDDDPDSIDIHTATVDAPDGFAPTREIWLEDKLAWMVSNAAFQPYPRSSRG